MADDAGFGTCVQCGGPGATGAIPGAWVHVDPVGCVSRLRTTLARLTAELAAVTAERDMWRGECASISAELDLPPGMRPMEGELRRMLGHNRALLAQVTTLTAERDEARAKNAGLVEHLKFAGTEREDFRQQLSVARCSERDGVWFWQGEGDRPESLSCPVVMSADTLREILRERDEARGLLGEAHHVLDQMHDEDDTIGRLKVDVPADGHPRQWLFDYVTQYGHGLRARIAAHLGRSE